MTDSGKKRGRYDNAEVLADAELRREIICRSLARGEAFDLLGPDGKKIGHIKGLPVRFSPEDIARLLGESNDKPWLQ